MSRTRWAKRRRILAAAGIPWLRLLHWATASGNLVKVSRMPRSLHAHSVQRNVGACVRANTSGMQIPEVKRDVTEIRCRKWRRCGSHSSSNLNLNLNPKL
jgi:hypothetical protein